MTIVGYDCPYKSFCVYEISYISHYCYELMSDVCWVTYCGVRGHAPPII